MIDDDRVRCVQCMRLVGGWCTNAVNAGLSRRRDRQEVGPMLASMPQRCPAFVTKPVKKAKP